MYKTSVISTEVVENEYETGKYSFYSISDFKKPDYFKTKWCENWGEKLYQLLDHMDKYDELPTKDTSPKLYNWYMTQKRDYNDVESPLRKHNERYIMWKRAIRSEEYHPIINKTPVRKKTIRKNPPKTNQYYADKKQWEINIDRVTEFVKENKRYPCQKSPGLEYNRFKFYNRQINHYNNNHALMKHDDIRKQWETVTRYWNTIIENS